MILSRGRFAPLLSALLFISCAHAVQDPEIRRAAARVQLMAPHEVPADYEIIREVVGYSCARQIGSSPSVEEAEHELRIAAGKLAADAVTNYICQPTGLSMGKNCWKTIECRGDAIRFRPQ